MSIGDKDKIKPHMTTRDLQGGLALSHGSYSKLGCVENKTEAAFADHGAMLWPTERNQCKCATVTQIHCEPPQGLLESYGLLNLPMTF